MKEDVDSLTVLRARRNGQHLSQQEKLEAQANFLGRFAEDGNVTEACKAAGVSRTIIYQWKDKNTAFRELFEEAEKQVCDTIRAEIFRRAIEGDEEVVVSMGKVMVDGTGKPYVIHKRSDTLLLALAKSKMLEFRDKQPETNITVDVEGAKVRLMAKLGRLPDDESESESR